MPGELAVGLCIPNTCSKEDIRNLMNKGECLHSYIVYPKYTQRQKKVHIKG